MSGQGEKLSGRIRDLESAQTRSWQGSIYVNIGGRKNKMVMLHDRRKKAIEIKQTKKE